MPKTWKNHSVLQDLRVTTRQGWVCYNRATPSYFLSDINRSRAIWVMCFDSPRHLPFPEDYRQQNYDHVGNFPITSCYGSLQIRISLYVTFCWQKSSSFSWFWTTGGIVQETDYFTLFILYLWAKYEPKGLDFPVQTMIVSSDWIWTKTY